MTRIVWIIVIAWSQVGSADSEAEVRFREGRRHLVENRLFEACTELARSRALEPRTGTLLNLGDCQARLGQTATAYATFLEARQRAVLARDERRVAEAERRATALEPDVPRLTVVLSSVVPGTVVRWNGEDIERATWNTARPLDPGRYTIEVTAPGHRVWSRTHVIAPRERAVIVVNLVADRVASSPIGIRTFGVGVLVGAGVQRENLMAGARLSGAVAVPGGALRAIGSFIYSQYPDEPADPTLRTTVYSFAGSADYVWMPHARLGFAAGFGIGLDYDVVNRQDPMRQNDVGTFWAVRASPAIVRLRDGDLELGLHMQLQIAGDELITNGIVAADWYLW